MSDKAIPTLTTILKQDTDCKLQLVDLLLTFGVLTDATNRSFIIGSLPDNIKFQITDAPQLAPRQAVLNILTGCLQFENGLNELVKLLDFLAPESIPLINLHNFLAALIPPTPEPTLAPPAPAPGATYLSFCQKLLEQLHKLQLGNPTYNYAGVPTIALTKKMLALREFSTSVKINLAMEYALKDLQSFGLISRAGLDSYKVSAVGREHTEDKTKLTEQLSQIELAEVPRQLLVALARLGFSVAGAETIYPAYVSHAQLLAALPTPPNSQQFDVYIEQLQKEKLVTNLQIIGGGQTRITYAGMLFCSRAKF